MQDIILNEKFEKIKDRTNVILLGDNISDIDMAVGFSYAKIIKIGFLNENIESNLENYKKAFDAVLFENSGLQSVSTLLKEIIS